MVVTRGVFAALEQSSAKQPGGEGLAPDHQLVALDAGFYAHLQEHLEDGFRAVGLFGGQASHACDTALACAESGEHGDNREEVGRIRKVLLEGFQRGFPYADGAALQLRDHGARIHEDVDDAQVGLQGGGVHTDELGRAEDGAGHEEVGGRAPVAFDVEIGGAVVLAAAYLEVDAGAAGPVVRFKHFGVALHFAPGLDAEMAQPLAAELRGMGIADTHPICPVLVRECCEAGLKAKLMNDGPAMKWSKMISNLLSNAASAIFNMTPAEVFSDPDSYELEIKQLRETLAVMKAMNISPVNIPGVPIKLLCFAVTSLPSFLAKPALVKAVGGGRGSKMPSFYIDLHAGRKESEVEFLNGAVVRYGSKNGVPTPVNQAYYEVLTKLSAGDLPLNTYERNPKALRDDFRI